MSDPTPTREAVREAMEHISANWRSCQNQRDILRALCRQQNEALECSRINTELLQEVAYNTYVENGVAIESIDAALAPMEGVEDGTK